VKKLILIGAGGHAKSCIDVINSEKKFKIYGLIDKKKSNISRYNYLGNEKYLEKIQSNKKCFIYISIGFIKSPKNRIDIFKKFKKMNFRFATIISSLSYVSTSASIGEGSMIHHFAVVNSDAVIGLNSIINTSAIIEHDVKVGNNCHISTGAIVNGGATIGDGTFVGSGSIIREKVKIGKNCIIGMGSIVKKDLKNFSVLK